MMHPKCPNHIPFRRHSCDVKRHGGEGPHLAHVYAKNEQCLWVDGGRQEPDRERKVGSQLGAGDVDDRVSVRPITYVSNDILT